MSKAIIDWATLNSSLAVALAIVLVALVLAVLGLLLALWLKPKLTELETLRTLVAELKTSASRGASAADDLAGTRTSIAVLESGLRDIKAQGYLQEIGAIKVRLESLEVSRDGDAALLAHKLQTLEQKIATALAGMDALQMRSEEEIARIQAESASTVETIRRESRDELVRQNTAERNRLALEQAEQDLQLAQIREQLSRGYEPFHTEALARAQSAQARLEALRVQAAASTIAAA